MILPAIIAVFITLFFVGLAVFHYRKQLRKKWKTIVAVILLGTASTLTASMIPEPVWFPEDSWVSPTGFEDPSTEWTDETNIYDEGTDTYAYGTVSKTSWSSFIHATHAALTSNKLRFNAEGWGPGTWLIDVDVYKDGGWVDVYSGTFTAHDWVEKAFAEGSVEKIGISLYNPNASPYNGKVYEIDFWEVAAGDTTKPTYSDVGTNTTVAGQFYSISDAFTDETKVASTWQTYVNTDDGFVRLALTSTTIQQWNYSSGYRMSQGYPIGDTDNDGLNELFFEDNNTLVIYKWNGTAYELNYTIPTLFGDGERITGYVCGDTDGDSQNELFISWYNGNITCYEWNGSDYEKTFQYEIANVSLLYDLNIGETNNETSYNEIIVCADPDSSETTAEIIVLTYNGSTYIVNGTYDTSGHLAAHMCGIGDVDDDGNNEIVFTSGDNIYIIEWNGTAYSYVDSIELGEWIYGIAIAELDGDNTPEILVGNRALSANATIWLYEWNGTTFEERDSVTWENEKKIIEGVCFGNFDDDADIEVVATTNSSVHILFWNGTALEEESYSPIQPFQDDESTPMAMIGDADNDGIPELVVNDLGYYGNALGDIWVYKYNLSPQSTGTLYSTNLLSGKAVSSINTFNYTVSNLPAQTTLEIQFSQDNSTWYNSIGGSSWQTLSQGTNTIDLSGLGWSGANFYYRCAFNSTDDATPKLNYIAITYGFPACLFYTKWTDETGLATTGGYIYGTNNTGTWVNETWSAFTANPDWSNVTKTLNSTYSPVQWQIWANDTSDNWNTTGLQTLHLTTKLSTDWNSFTALNLDVGYTLLQVNASLATDNIDYTYLVLYDSGTTLQGIFIYEHGGDISVTVETNDIFWIWCNEVGEWNHTYD